MKKELNAIEAANRQLKESIAEQEQVFLKQREQMEKAKITLSKMQAEQQARVQKMELDFLQAKMKRSIDDIYSNEVSVHDKEQAMDKFDHEKEEKQQRGLSGKSNSKSISLRRGNEEPKFVTIKFDERDKGSHGKKPSLSGNETSAMDKNQIRNQVKNYDMDDQTKAFLENYLLDDAKPQDPLLEKEILPTGLSDDKVGDHSKELIQDFDLKKKSKTALDNKIPTKDLQLLKGGISNG